MVIGTYISITTLNVNGLNAESIKGIDGYTVNKQFTAIN